MIPQIIKEEGKTHLPGTPRGRSPVPEGSGAKTLSGQKRIAVSYDLAKSRAKQSSIHCARDLCGVGISESRSTW
jgi:hypothetical protein